MSERIKVLSNNRIYFLNPLENQDIQYGLAKSLNEKSEVFSFFVQPKNRNKVIGSIDKIEKMLVNPDLSISDKNLAKWIGDIECLLEPPVKVMGPKSLTRKLHSID